MSPPRPILADIDLHAYLDGELTEAEAREVELRLAADPKARALLHSLSLQRDALLREFALPTDCPVTHRLAHAVRRSGQSGRPPGFWLWGGLAAALALAATSGYVLRGYQQPPMAAAAPGFVETAMGAHLVFTPEVRRPVEIKAAEQQQLTYWLSKRVGMPIRPPDLASQGWSLVGGRLLADGPKPAAQLMYEDRGGRRLTLFVRGEAALANTAFQFTTRERLASFYWVDRPLAYVIAAEMERAELMRIADAVHSAFLVPVQGGQPKAGEAAK
jgi:anti-sigma factor RsiW